MYNVTKKHYFLALAGLSFLVITSVFLNLPERTLATMLSQTSNFRQGIRVCNNAPGSGRIYMAFGVSGPQSSRIRTVGWYGANEGQCVVLQSSSIDQRSNYYLYAISGANSRLFWEGFQQLCVRSPERFRIDDAQNTRNCRTTRNFYRLSTRNRSHHTEYLEN